MNPSQTTGTATVQEVGQVVGSYHSTPTSGTIFSANQPERSYLQPPLWNNPCTLYFTLPHRFWLDSIWALSGKDLNQQFVYNTSGVHVDSTWNPSGLQMEFTSQDLK